MIRKNCDLLGKPYPSSEHIKGIMEQFEAHLRDYLQQQQAIRSGFSALSTALKDSVKAMDTMLADIGNDAPELKQVQRVLDAELPHDPNQARHMLQQAAQHIRRASQKLSQTGQQVKNTMAKQLSEMNKLNQRLQQAEAQALNDPLTGLGNRRKLRQYLQTLSENTASLLMLDIDYFKNINDTHGHDAGDTVLAQLANIMQQSVRSTDMLARLGGEEFCLVIPGMHADQAVSTAEHIRASVQQHSFTHQTRHIAVTISIGVAQRQASESIQQWFQRADQALYRAKNNGRNRVVIASHHPDT